MLTSWSKQNLNLRRCLWILCSALVNDYVHISMHEYTCLLSTHFYISAKSWYVEFYDFLETLEILDIGTELFTAWDTWILFFIYNVKTI